MAGLLYARRTRITFLSTLFEVSQRYGKLCMLVETGMGVRRNLAVWRHGRFVFTSTLKMKAIISIDELIALMHMHGYSSRSIDQRARITYFSFFGRLWLSFMLLNGQRPTRVQVNWLPIEDDQLRVRAMYVSMTIKIKK